MFRFCKNNVPAPVEVKDENGNTICVKLSKEDIVYNKPQNQMTKAQHASWANKFKYR